MTKKKPPFAFVLYCDGGCNNLTHSHGYASYVVYQGEAEVARQTRRPYPEVRTSQEAEYRALLDALGWIEGEYQPGLFYRVWTDSRLLVNQGNGVWGCKAENLLDYFKETRRLLAELPGVKLAWTPRVEIVKRLGH